MKCGIDKIKIKRTFKINDLNGMWLSGIFIILVSFFLFKSGNSFLVAFGVLFIFISSILFGIGMVMQDILVINFYDEYFVVKKVFNQKKYYYDEISSIETKYYSHKAYDVVAIYIKPYGESITLLTYEPLELFFQVKSSYIKYQDTNSSSYIDIFENLNKDEQETIEKICNIRSKYKKVSNSK